LTELKKIASGITKDCAQDASTLAEGIACTTQGTYISMMAEIEKTKNNAADGIAAGFNNLVYE
jgi:hypothetical protein